MTGLTPRQYQLLTFIERFTSEAGYAPSYEQMRAALGLGSKSAIHRLMTGLRDRGRISNLPGAGHRRSVEVIRKDPYSAEALRNLSWDRLWAVQQAVDAEMRRRPTGPVSMRPTARPEGAGRVAG